MRRRYNIGREVNNLPSPLVERRYNMECEGEQNSPSVLVSRRYNMARSENKSSNLGLKLNRSQCGGCSTEYITRASN